MDVAAVVDVDLTDQADHVDLTDQADAVDTVEQGPSEREFSKLWKVIHARNAEYEEDESVKLFDGHEGRDEKEREKDSKLAASFHRVATAMKNAVVAADRAAQRKVREVIEAIIKSANKFADGIGDNPNDPEDPEDPDDSGNPGNPGNPQDGSADDRRVALESKTQRFLAKTDKFTTDTVTKKCPPLISYMDKTNDLKRLFAILPPGHRDYYTWLRVIEIRNDPKNEFATDGCDDKMKRVLKAGYNDNSSPESTTASQMAILGLETVGIQAFQHVLEEEWKDFEESHNASYIENMSKIKTAVDGAFFKVLETAINYQRSQGNPDLSRRYDERPRQLLHELLNRRTDDLLKHMVKTIVPDDLIDITDMAYRVLLTHEKVLRRRRVEHFVKSPVSRKYLRHWASETPADKREIITELKLPPQGVFEVEQAYFARCETKLWAILDAANY